MTYSMFEYLFELPLFQGATRQKIADVVASVKFGFSKYEQGQMIACCGEECEHISFIIGGAVRQTLTDKDGTFELSSTLEAPAAISPDFLFGRVTYYPCSAAALGGCSILTIGKNDFLRILESDRIFMYNYLNMLSARVQRPFVRLLSLGVGHVDRQLAFMTLSLTQPGSRDIVIRDNAGTLSAFFNQTDAEFTLILDGMSRRGLIEYTEGVIKIPDRKAMISLLEMP